MSLLLLVLAPLFALAYAAAMGVPVRALASLGRLGAVAGVVVTGFVARWTAGAFHGVWASEPLSIAYVPFFAGVAWALSRATRLPPPHASGARGGQSLPSPLRGLARSAAADQRRMDRNLLALTLVVVPISVVLNYAGEYLQRRALGYQTDYLALHSSWDYAKYFESGPLGVSVALLLGGLLYEGVLLRLPPASSAAAGDRLALHLLPLMLVPWLVIGAARAQTFHGIALVQGLAVYFFLVRRFPEPSRAIEDEIAELDAPPTPHAPADRRSDAPRRRYAAIGGALGAAMAAYALVAADFRDAGALAIAAEQMFFVTLPTSVPLRTLMLAGGDLRYDSSLRLALFVLAAPVANGVLLGWALARGLEALRRRRGSAPDEKTSQSLSVIGS